MSTTNNLHVYNYQQTLNYVNININHCYKSSANIKNNFTTSGKKVVDNDFNDVYKYSTNIVVKMNSTVPSTKSTEKQLNKSAGEKHEFIVGEVGKSQYKLIKKIARGSFGDIFVGINSSNSQEMAVKLESISAKNPQLSNENTIYSILREGPGIPNVHWFGQVRRYNVMVMDLLGPSLSDHFYSCNKKFTLKTVLMLANQMMEAIEYIHSKHIIHRDIKPANFVMGVGSNSYKLYLIDFGLSKSYRDTFTKEHIPYKENQVFVGTAKYASNNALLGREQSRRDDLIALGHIWIYFLEGYFTWENMDGKAETKENLSNKIKTPLNVLCGGVCKEFLVYLKYCQQLGFEEKPDYSYLKQIFGRLFITHNYIWDHKYDWS